MKRMFVVLVMVLAQGCESDPVEEVCVPEPGCVPECVENSCGDDGCGCSCGQCDAGFKCRDGQCVCGLCGGECGECPEIEWVPVSEGKFTMGCVADAQHVDSFCGTPDVLPPHEVTLAGFEVARYEVTAALYAQCVQTGACLPSDLNGYNSTAANSGMSDHPINYVTWFDAEAFCMWAGGRLGSEAEWEYAARGSDGRIYPWGSAPPTCTKAWTSADNCAKNITHSVGLLPGGQSPWGIDDMAGNVFEWVADSCHSESYVGAPNDGSVWEGQPGDVCHVQRGGSFARGPEAARSFNRMFQSGDVDGKDVGIRCFR